MENNAPFPRHPKILVYILAIEKLMHQTSNLLLHLPIQDHVIPARVLHLLIQGFAPDPVPIVNIYRFIPRRWWDLPCPDRRYQVVCFPIVGHDGLFCRWLFEYVLIHAVADVHDVDEEVLSAPFVNVLGEGTRLGDAGGRAKIAGTEDGLIYYVESRGRVSGKGECEEVDCIRATHQLFVPI